MMRGSLLTLALCAGLSGWAQPTLFGSATVVWDSSRAVQINPYMVGQDALYLGASGGVSDEGVLLSYSAKHKTTYHESVGNWRLSFLNALTTYSPEWTLEFNGRARIDAMSTVPGGEALIQVGYFDSLVYKGATYYQNNQYRQAFLKVRPGDTAAPDLLWEQPDTTAMAILAHNGNILMVGSSGFGGNVRLHEVSPNGVIVRSKTLTGFGYISELMELPDGTLLIGGGCPSFQVSLDSINVSPGATYNTYLACLAPDWTGRWMRYWEDVSCHKVHLAYSDHPSLDGTYIFMAGPNYLPFSIDSLSHAGANTSGEDFFLVAFDKAGKAHWIEEIPGNQGFSRFGLPNRHALVVEGDNVYLLGRHYGTDMYWGTDTVGSGWAVGNSATLHRAATMLHFHLPPYAQGGPAPIPDPVFTQAMELRAWGIYGDAYPSALVAGSALNSNHPMVYVYHPDSLGVSGGLFPGENLLTTKSHSDALISFDLTVNIIVCGVPMPWRLFPNPSSNEAWITSFEGERQVRILDAYGRLVWKATGRAPMALPSEVLPSGLYYVTMDDAFHPTQPWVVQH